MGALREWVSFFAFLTFVCLTINAEEDLVVSNEPTRCINTYPGLAKLSQGVDITKIDMRESDNKGFVMDVIDFTCNPREDIPIQMQKLSPSRSEDFKAKIVFTNTVAELRKAMSVEVGIKADELPKGSFSASSSYETAQKGINKRSVYLAQTKSSVSLFVANLMDVSLLNMSRSLSAAIERLPEILNEQSADKYRNFVATYGTHFFEKGQFGGFLSFSSEIDSNYVKHNSEEKVAAEAKASYLTMLSTHGKTTGSTNFTSSEYKKKSFETTTCMGGKSNLFGQKTETYTAWKESLPSMPWLFSGSLRTLTDLIPEGPKKVAIKGAIEAYLLKARVSAVKRSLDEYVKTSLFVRNWKLVEALMEEITGQVSPTREMVETLERDVKDFKALFTCPTEWQQFVDHCYLKFTGRQDWYGAQKSCEKEGSYMASFHSQEEWTFAKKNLVGTDRVFLGGLKRKQSMGSGPYSWFWMDNTNWDYTDFKWGSPNSERELCLSSDDGKWDDADCYSPQEYVCKKVLPLKSG